MKIIPIAKLTDFHVLCTMPASRATLDLLSRTQYKRKGIHCPRDFYAL